MQISPIADVAVTPIMTPEASRPDRDGSSDTVVVRAFSEGPDLHCWSLNGASELVGRDPLELRAPRDQRYATTISPGRRGLGVVALPGDRQGARA